MKHMKTKGLAAAVLICLLILGGCGKKTKVFDMDGAQTLTVTSVSGQKTEAKDRETAEKIMGRIGALEFERDKSAANVNGFGPIVTWYGADGGVIDAVSVMDAETIMYDGYFWTAKGGNIDTESINAVISP